MVSRVTQDFHTDYGFKAFILHGDNITDRFIHEDLTITNINVVLEKFLLIKGFERLIFYSTHNSYFERKKKIDCSNSTGSVKTNGAGQPEQPVQTKKKRINLREKVTEEGRPPLDRAIVVLKENSNAEVITEAGNKNAGWAFVLDKIDAAIMKGNSKSAVIFTDAHNMQNHGEFNPEFESKFHNWILNLKNNSLIVFLYINDRVEDCVMPPYMRNHIDKPDMQIIHIGGVSGEELERLINRKRLVDGMKVDWKILANAVRVLGDMSKATCAKLEQWKSEAFFGSANKFNKSTILFWKQNNRVKNSKINLESIGMKTIESLDKEAHALDIEEAKEELKVVRCQQDNIDQILDSLDTWYLGKKEKPLTILLNGTSGTGKTFTAECLAGVMEQYGYKYYYKAMTEFKSDADLSKIIGSPTGYVGSNVRPEIFTKNLEANGKLVICFDEIDKAYEGITESLMQLFEKGFLTWNNERGDFSKCIIMLTSNAEMDKLVELKQRYLKEKRDITGGDFYNEMNEILLEANFPSYVMGRMKKVVVYNTLSPDAIIDITMQETNKLFRNLNEKITVVDFDELFLFTILTECQDSSEGARIITKTVENLLSRKNILTNFVKNNPNAQTVAIVKAAEGYSIIEAQKDEKQNHEESKKRIIKQFEESKKKLGKLDKAKMEEILAVVKCQQDNIAQIITGIRSWFQNPQMPYNMFLAGTSGTGKSFTAEKLAESLQKAGYKYFFQAMNECQSEIDGANIFGTPKGIAGSTTKPKLFDELNKAKGKLVICFDEIEKAYGGFYNRIMSLMQNGVMDWAYGNGDFKKCVIVMTSNIAMERLVELKARYNRQGIDTIANMEFNSEVNKVLNDNGIPTFITGRIQLSLIYNPLNYDAVFDISVQEINKFAMEKKLTVKHISPLFLADIMKECEGSVEGARKIQRAISSKLGDILTDFVDLNPDTQEIVIE